MNAPLASRVAQFEQDVDVVHGIVHGPASGEGSMVATEGGALRTLAKLLADAQAEVDESVGLRNDLSSGATGKGASLIAAKLDDIDAAERTQRDRNAETVSVMDFNGPAAHTRFIRALTYLDENGGGLLRVNRGIQLTIEETILKLLENDIEIVFEPGAKLIAVAGLASPVLDLRASNSVITERIARIRNPRIDCSAGVTTAPGQGCSAISAQYFAQLIVTDVALYGGELRTNSNADSSITPIACDYVHIERGHVRGFSDGGVYIGGDNTVGTVGDGITATIRGVMFTRCNNALLAKRDLSHLRFVDCDVIECGAGVIAAEITTPNYTNPVRRLDVINNRFRRNVSNIARFRGPTKGQFSGNIVEDWGFEPDGVSGAAGANGYALVVQGASGLDVKNNTFVMNAWTLNDQRAVLLDNVTLDSVLYSQGGHAFADNSYRNLPRVLVETAGGSASTYLNETYDGIATAKFSGLHAGSLVIFQETGKRGLRSLLNGIEQPIGPTGVISSAVDVTLTANDSGASCDNVGAAGLVTYTVPGAAPGTEFDFTCMDSDGLRVQFTSGDLLRTGTGNTTNNGSATTTTVGATMRIRAKDSTNWVVLSMTGTWTLA